MLDENFYEELASVVRYHRKKTGLNRIELAHLAGVGKTVIYDIENAKPSVRLSTIIKILNVLNIQIKLISPIVRVEEYEKGKSFF